MDGTLVDSEKVWEVALHELAAWYGGRLSPAARRAMIGTSTPDTMAILHEDLGQPWRDAAVGAAWLDDRMVELFASGLQWRPGALGLLTAVRSAGIPTALVTSTGRRLVDVALVSMGAENFDAVVCGDEVAAAKPDPTPYRTAAALLDVPVAECVAVEDSSAGVASARAAGVAVVAVPAEVPLPAAEGVLIVDSLVDVDLDVLASVLPAAPAAPYPPIVR